MAALLSSVKESKAEDRSDEENPFSRYYAQLTHQQNMLQDSVRTGTYQKAVAANQVDFAGKTVLDVGTGSGILAIFAARAGARKVYAVEASDIAESARRLVSWNGLSSVVEVVKGKVEEVELPEKVDLIISEPMGFLLVHERMLESYVHARQSFLKPNGKMFPSTGMMFFLPFSDWDIYNEQTAKSEFWSNKNFFGVDLTCLKEPAVRENFTQAVVGCFDPATIISNFDEPASYKIDFSKVTPEELQTIHLDFEYTVTTTAIMHGLACWFDVDFIGTQCTVTLSTGPTKPTTHWYQCRLLLPNPIAVNATQVIRGTIDMKANEKYSYDVNFTVNIVGTNIKTESCVRLHDQIYHYLHSDNSASTGVYNTSATEGMTS